MWKVATWNVNSVNARLERLLAFLQREAPDVVLLQELKCETPKFPLEAISRAGYHCAEFGQKTYNGVAILSRTPMENIARGFGDGELDEARFIAADVLGVRVASAYIPNGQAVGSPKYAYKLQWLSRLRAYLDKNATALPWLIGGDFNVAPTAADVYDAAAEEGNLLFSPPEREALSNVCAYGLGDTFRKHHPDTVAFSWWDYRQLAFAKNLGFRIDFLLATAPLLAQCTSARIDRDERKGKGASDHAPVLAEFSH